MCNKKIATVAGLALLNLEAKNKKALCLDVYKDNGKSLLDFAFIINNKRNSSTSHSVEPISGLVEASLKALSEREILNRVQRKAENVDSFFKPGNTVDKMTINIDLGTGALSAD